MQSSRQHSATTPAYQVAKQPYSPPRQDARSSQITRNNTNKRGAKWAARVALWPLCGIRQAWNDYQNGRIMRKREGRAESYGRGGDRHCKVQSGADTRSGPDQTRKAAEEASEPRKAFKDWNAPRNECHNRPRRLNRGWEYQDGEFPWRIERVVQEEDNWRGVWVLEVKDMWSMEWKKQYQQWGCQWRLGTVSQPHWPFPYEGPVNRVIESLMSCATG